MVIWLPLLLLCILLTAAVTFLYRHNNRLKAANYKLSRDLANLSDEQVNFETLRDGVLKVMDDAILIMDSKGIIRFANDSARDLFKRPSIGQTLMSATRHYELDELAETAHTMRHEVHERRFIIDEYVLQARVMDIEKFTIVLLHDVTVMQQLSRARREMIANISHELNTPITTIGILIDTLLSGAVEKPDIRAKMLENMHHETETLSQLVQEMRDLSLIESRQMPIKLVPVELQPLIRRSIDSLIHLCDRKGQTIDFYVPEEVVVLADEQQIPRVLKNIVHNAIKFTPQGGHIEIHASLNGEEAIVQVKDTGPGISQHDLPRIFERFFQADQSRQHGTGLGLAIVRHIVLAHGGRVWAENNADRGTSFFVSLPLGTQSTAHPVD